MNKEDIIRMAKECGNWSGQTVEMNDVGLERFAKLVRAAIEQPRQWQGLTDEEIAEVISGQFAERNYWVKITKALEAKLKEKNA